MIDRKDSKRLEDIDRRWRDFLIYRNIPMAKDDDVRWIRPLEREKMFTDVLDLLKRYRKKIETTYELD